MAWWSKKASGAQPSKPAVAAAPAPRNHAADAWLDLPPLTENSLDLTKRIRGLLNAAGMAYVVSGAAPVRQCFAEIERLVVPVGYSTAMPNGLGWFAGMVDNIALGAVSGPEGSAAVIVPLPSMNERAQVVAMELMDSLKAVSEPWYFDTTSMGRGPSPVVELIAASEGVPLWDVGLSQVVAP